MATAAPRVCSSNDDDDVKARHANKICALFTLAYKKRARARMWPLALVFTSSFDERWLANVGARLTARICKKTLVSGAACRTPVAVVAATADADQGHWRREESQLLLARARDVAPIQDDGKFLLRTLRTRARARTNTRAMRSSVSWRLNAFAVEKAATRRRRRRRLLAIILDSRAQT